MKVEKKNPVLYPNFAKKYTSESVQDNDMIVVNNKNGKSQYLSFQSDMIEMTVRHFFRFYGAGSEIIEVRVDGYVGNSESNIKKYKESLRGRRPQHAVLKR